MNENDEIVETALRDLWPSSSVVDEGQGSGAGPVRARYAVLPSRSDPRLLVPVDVVASRADSRRWRRSTDEETAVPGLAPSRRHHDRLEVRGGGEGLDTWLGKLLGGPVTFSIRLGPGQPHDMPVLQVFDRSGRAVARVKIGATPQAVEALRAEARALVAVADRGLRLVRAPRVLGSLTWHDKPVLVLESFDTIPWQPGSTRRPPEAAMDELAHAFHTHDAPLEGSAWWQRQWDLTARLDPLTRSRLGRCLESIAFQAAGQDLAWGGWHGDWTPSTMARRGDRVLLWNWPHFEAEAPLGLDRLHFLTSRTTSHHDADPDLLLAALRSADIEAMTPGTAAHLRALLYLVALATRYARVEHGQASSDLPSRSESVVVALETLSGEVRETG